MAICLSRSLESLSVVALPTFQASKPSKCDNWQGQRASLSPHRSAPPSGGAQGTARPALLRPAARQGWWAGRGQSKRRRWCSCKWNCRARTQTPLSSPGGMPAARACKSSSRRARESGRVLRTWATNSGGTGRSPAPQGSGRTGRREARRFSG